MTAPVMIALSLLLSVVAAALTLSLASFLTQLDGGGLDPRLNEAVWRAALWLPLAPPVLVAALLLTPAPVAPPTAPIATPVQMAQGTIELTAPLTTTSTPPALPLNLTTASQIGLALALGLSLLRLGLLGLRTRRLGRLMQHATPAAPDVATAVAEAARLLNQRAPIVRISAHTPEALLAGLFRPTLVLPLSLAETPDAPAFHAIVRHELAHLKRGDPLGLWLEEALLVLLAVNPLAPLLRRRRAAAREEACDALALSGADTETRHAYARSLIEALRAANTPPHSTPELSTPALTFTGHPRSQAMHRLKSILTPPMPANRKIRLAALTLGAAVTGLLGLGSYAVAAQRTPQAAPVQDESAAAHTPPTPRTLARSTSIVSHRTINEDPAAEARLAVETVTQTATSNLTSAQQDRFQRASSSATNFKTVCASSEDADAGFCSGIMSTAALQSSAQGTICAPTLANGQLDQRATTDRARRLVAGTPATSGQTATDFARTTLTRAWPCGNQAATPLPPVPEGRTRVLVSMDYGPHPVRLTSDDRLRVFLTGFNETGAKLAQEVAMSAGENNRLPDTVFVDLHDEYFPKGRTNTAYELRAEISHADKTPIAVSEPVTIRLAPGSRALAQRLRPQLVMRPL